MNCNRFLLTESPTTTDRLVELFVTIGESDKNDVVAVLPIDSEAGNQTFTDQFARLAFCEPKNIPTFGIFGIRAGHFHCAVDQMGQEFAFSIQIAPDDHL